ncbi:MAG: sensor histidine kinase [Cyclobacteriaceae bacterium]
MINELRKDYPWHLLFWGSYFILKVAVVEFFRVDYWTTVAAVLISLPLKIVAAYLLILFLVPEYLLKRKYVKFIGLTILSIVVVAFTRRVMDIYIVYPISVLYADNGPFWSLNMFRNLIYIYPVVGLGSAMYFVAHWVRNFHHSQELEKQKLEAELKMLKNQINPHFLFNTINNIYSLALERSEKTPDALLKLSELLHAMLYDCSGDKIILEKEVQLIHNYLNLEKLRYGDRVDIQFGVIGDTNFKVSPLLLIPLVENAFKHGVSESIEESWVRIDLKVGDDQIVMAVENSKVESINGLSNSGFPARDAEKAFGVQVGSVSPAGDTERSVISTTTPSESLSTAPSESLEEDSDDHKVKSSVSVTGDTERGSGIAEHKDSSLRSKGGIGLTNLKKRLALEYPERHQLTIRDQETFYAKLVLNNE